MENTYIQQLDYTAQTSQNIPAKRKILDYYAKLDHEKERKTKCELFTIQNIQGLLSVIQINSNKLQFLSFEELCSQLTLFLQNAKRIQCRNKDLVKISEQKFIILLDGIIMKKTDLLSLTINQMMITQTIFKNRNSGLVTKQKQKKFPSALNNNTMPIKRPNVRKIVTNEHLSPIPIHFNFLDNKEFQCCSSVIYLEFPLISLETFQNRIDLKEKQCLALFIQVCLGVQSKKTFLRVVPKLQRVNICCNRQFFGAFKTIYMIYKGEIVLQSEKYQISLNKNGVVYKQEGAPFKMVSKNPQTLIFSIQMGEIIQIFKEVNSETLQYIMLNLKNLDQKRQGLLQRLQTKTEDQQLIEPIFDTQVLNFKYFEKRNQQNESKEYLKKNRKYFIPKSACQAKSSRMRYHQQNQKQNTLQSDLSIFLSNYPYVKIVQSEIKAHQILKTGVNERSMQRKMAAYQKFTDEQKKKVQKDRKKFYYMDKVRRMKIKNIAEREIPNGHKKNFKMDEAEKQISQYTLFKNIIEYPMNGVSENATKSSKNKKQIQKLVRMCTVSSKIQRRTSGNQIKSFENIDIKYETNNQLDLDSLQSQRGNSRDEQNQSNHIKQKLSPQESQFKKEFTTGNSFYWTNILNPHLPTQKQMKIKRKRLSSNKIEVELQNDNFWEQKQNPRKDLNRKKYRQMKQQKSPNNLSFQRSYKRIKTTLH